MTEEERGRVEKIVNEGIWADHPVEIAQRSYDQAVESGAMALFGEKYGDEVRVVNIPGVSMELCGGTHARHTGEIGLFRMVGESGVAAGVRRVEGLTGRGAYDYLRGREDALGHAAAVLKTQPDNLSHRAEQLLEEKAELEGLLDDLRSEAGSGETRVVSESLSAEEGGPQYLGIRLKARDADDARKWGDRFVSQGSGVAVLVAEMPGDKRSMFTFVTDDLISQGVRADAIVREVAAVVGGRGGGRPHMAQAGVEDPERIDEALEAGLSVVRDLMASPKA
jgi:alanyl-tRNA synthetase